MSLTTPTNNYQLRESSRKAKDFGTADLYREQLRSKGIEVFDRDREWRAKDGRRGMIPPEAGSIICSLADDDIIGLVSARGGTVGPLVHPSHLPLLPPRLFCFAQVSQREQARRSKDFGTADALRTQLRAAGVELFDREKYWRVNDGRRGGYDDALHLDAGGQQGGVGGAW